MRWIISNYVLGIVCATGLLLLVPDRPCFGQGLLDFQFDPNGPLILGINGSLDYNASTGEFSGTSLPLTLSSSTLPGGESFVRFSGNPQLSFDLFVNPNGTFQKDPDGFNLSGTLSIGGTKISGTLLSGNFTAFGAESPGLPTWVANALVTPTGGLLTQAQTLANGSTLPPQFPIRGLSIGIDFFAENVTSGTLGDFTQSFSSSSIKDDTGLTMAPEPATWMLWTVAIAILSVFGFVTKRGTRR
jgi:hypothetical protein